MSHQLCLPRQRSSATVGNRYIANLRYAINRQKPRIMRRKSVLRTRIPKTDNQLHDASQMREARCEIRTFRISHLASSLLLLIASSRSSISRFGLALLSYFRLCRAGNRLGNSLFLRHGYVSHEVMLATEELDLV